ncbi:MAG: hypothetical protein Q8O84_04000 [Nanoarchaeota archaeon]|nr:hypothetical protein [Nanoarchaeota archaeon]
MNLEDLSNQRRLSVYHQKRTDWYSQRIKESPSEERDKVSQEFKSWEGNFRDYLSNLNLVN